MRQPFTNENITNENKSFSFPQAIAASKTLMQQMNDQDLSETQIETEISKLVQSQAGARGFFVAYLTDDLPLADSPTSGVIQGLKTAPDIVEDLLVKNLAMSTGMKLTHLRNQDEELAESSSRVNARTINLIQEIDSEQIEQELETLKSTILEGEGNYQEFLTKWGYDQEQKETIKEVAKMAIALID